MRIQGELLKLGIGVSATTIATVLRSPGLRPAPRRIGPTWSQFLRAQAHSMVGGGLNSAVGDRLEGAASEPHRPPQDGPDRQADDRRCPAVAAQPRLAPHPLPAEPLGTAVPSPLQLEGRCARRHRIDRTRAPRAAPAWPDTECSARRQSHSRSPSVPPPTTRRIPRKPPSDFAPLRRRNESTTTASCQPEPSFFTPRPCDPAATTIACVLALLPENSSCPRATRRGMQRRSLRPR